MIRSTASMFSSVVIVDVGPVRGESPKARSDPLNSVAHLATVQ